MKRLTRHVRPNSLFLIITSANDCVRSLLLLLLHVRFAGASAGAVVAALLAIGLSAKQLYRELANTDLYNLIKDAENTASSLYSLVTKFGMNPGTALYRYLGLLFYKCVFAQPHAVLCARSLACRCIG